MRISVRVEAPCEDRAWEALRSSQPPKPLVKAQIDEEARIVTYSLNGLDGWCRAWADHGAVVIRCELGGLRARLVAGRLRRALEEWARGLAKC